MVRRSTHRRTESARERAARRFLWDNKVRGSTTADADARTPTHPRSHATATAGGKTALPASSCDRTPDGQGTLPPSSVGLELRPRLGDALPPLGETCPCFRAATAGRLAALFDKGTSFLREPWESRHGGSLSARHEGATED
ncbi:hypothetical protein MRX96_054614 [Rhipicephalus microplus]